MYQRLGQDKLLIFLSILFTTLLYYFPILYNPKIILHRGNDLEEYYWPIFYYVKNNLILNHTLPLWDNLFFSGTPLLPDPQAPLFYIPNIIFLIMPLDIAFIASLLLHTFFGAIGIYLLAKYGFNLSRLTSLFVAFVFIAFPKSAGFIEAGHFGLVAAITWLPFFLLSIIKLIKFPTISWSILFGISSAGLFFTFPTVFGALFSTGSIVLLSFSFYNLIKFHKPNLFLKSLIAILMAVGLISISFLPQIEWIPQSTRLTLLSEKDVYPKWNGKTEFIKAIFPDFFGPEFIYNLDSEKWLAVGGLLTVLTLLGATQISRKSQFALLILISSILLVSLNNVSPIYPLLISIDWYSLNRVSTRIWILMILIIPILSGFGINKLIKVNKTLSLIIITFSLIELFYLSWSRFNKPVQKIQDFAPIEVAEYLNKDSGKFRVFCVTRCLSQKTIAQYNLEAAEGYGTLHQKNYYDQFIQLSQVFWDKYTLSQPPLEIYNYREIQPYSPDLATYNIKYVISPYLLKDKNLVIKKEFGKYKIYENTIVKPRAYFGNTKEARILEYTPNQIRVDTANHLNNQLILAEVYSPGWEAKLDGKIITKIDETADKLRTITLQPNTQYVDFQYIPKSFVIGRFLTSITIFLIIILLAKIGFNYRRENQNK